LWFDPEQISAWITDYNTTRPYSSLGYRMPAAYADHQLHPDWQTSRLMRPRRK
jgi:transposase InsO family protein